MRLGVDVDLTVFDTGRAWYEHLRALSSIKAPSFDDAVNKYPYILPYDLTLVFKDLDLQTSLDYWRGENVYDTIEPLKGCVEVLRDLKQNKGYEIVFVSTIKGNHHKSKYYAIEKHFPFLDGFIATKEKKYAKVDMMVDDRLNVLQKLDKGVVTVQKQTPFEQHCGFEPTFKFEDWNDFSKFVYRNY